MLKSIDECSKYRKKRDENGGQSSVSKRPFWTISENKTFWLRYTKKPNDRFPYCILRQKGPLSKYPLDIAMTEYMRYTFLINFFQDLILYLKAFLTFLMVTYPPSR